jgi:3-(3-hydroxy-phenyl)propionate hydroxylase
MGKPLLTHQCDVVIVGLGPTGAMLANLLGQYGWSVIGLERDVEIYPATRAIHFDDETMRIFQYAGLSQQIERISEPFTEMEYKRTPGGEPLLRLEVGNQDYRYGHALAWWFHQPTLEAQFREGLKRYSNVQVFYGVTADEITQTESSVVVTGRSQSGECSQISAKFLVGCDGGRSFVRKCAGIKLDSAKFDERWVVVDTRTRSGEKDKSMPPRHAQICDPRQPTTYVPLAGPYYRWELCVRDGKSVEEATDPAFVQQQLRAFVDLEKIEIVRVACYNFHALWARNWVAGRIILAGDAAHQMPPFLGQGLCSGIRDAHALSWRLNLILSGCSNANVLEHYSHERSAHVREIIRGAVFVGNLIQTRNRVLAFLRDNLVFRAASLLGPTRRAFMKAINRKRPLKCGCLGRSVLAGHLALQPRVTLPDGRVELLDDAIGRDFVVLGRRGSLAPHQDVLDDLRKALPVRVLEFGDGAESADITDHTGALQRWFSLHKIDFVLIRPDRYIFEAGSSQELKGAVHSLLSHLAIGNSHQELKTGAA